jgi:hypothetical protein
MLNAKTTQSMHNAVTMNKKNEWNAHVPSSEVTMAGPMGAK